MLRLTLVGPTLDGVAGVALLSGGDTRYRPAGGAVAKPVAIRFRRGGADLLVSVGTAACRSLALAMEGTVRPRSFAGWRDAVADAAPAPALPWRQPDVHGRQFAGGTLSDPAGGAAYSRRDAAASHRTGDGGVAALAGGRSRAGAAVLGITAFTGRLAAAGRPLALDQ